MRSMPLEPGLIRLFRLFLIVQLILIYGNVGAHSGRGYVESSPWFALAFGTAGVLFLMVYLSIPAIHKALGKFYLPLALVTSAVVSLVLQNLVLGTRFSVVGGSSEESAWQVFLFLFIPLVLTGWQYGFWSAFAFCTFTAILDYSLMRFGSPGFEQFQDTYLRLIFIRSFAFLLVGYIISRIMMQMRQQRLALQQANQKLIHYAVALEQLTLSRERNRLARELHDILAHTLSGLAVQLEGVKSLWESDSQQAYSMLDGSLAATRRGLTETRNAIQALRSTPLEDLGVELALQELVHFAAERAGFGYSFEKPEGIIELSENAGQCLYRVAQEALENVVKHAQASQVILRLENREDYTILTIHDDGVGFDPQGEVSAGHFGLRGMCERAELAGGQLSIESKAGFGTTVRLEVCSHD